MLQHVVCLPYTQCACHMPVHSITRNKHRSTNMVLYTQSHPNKESHNGCCDAGCLHCTALAGCAWCESTCTCKSATLSGQLTSQQCPTNPLGLFSWTKSPSQCPGALSKIGSPQCDPQNGYRAIAEVHVSGQQQLILNASQSSRVTLCSELSCGAHGSCVGSGLSASCVCANGWQGAACDIPPDPCFSQQQFCGTGMCMVQSGSLAMCLCANGSLAASCDNGAVIG